MTHSAAGGSAKPRGASDSRDDQHYSISGNSDAQSRNRLDPNVVKFQFSVLEMTHFNVQSTPEYL